MKPLVKYTGGKSRELKYVKELMPDHVRYFEPFVGGGAVFFGGTDCDDCYLNDSSENLIEFYMLLKEKDKEFCYWLAHRLKQWDEKPIEERGALYYEIRNCYNQGKYYSSKRKYADWFMLKELAFGGITRFNSKGGFNVPFSRSYATKDMRKKFVYILGLGVQFKLNTAQFNCMDFERFLGTFDIGEGDFMFVDPPYDCTYTNFEDNDFTKEDQIRLVELLKDFQGKFMMICLFTPFIQELYGTVKQFRIYTYSHKYGLQIKDRLDTEVTCAIVMNY